MMEATTTRKDPISDCTAPDFRGVHVPEAKIAFEGQSSAQRPGSISGVCKNCG